MNTVRGVLKVYLGAAPGVGKTCAMLEEAHDRLKGGEDVVVGVVETHGRSGTAARLEGLPVIPPRRVSYRGSTYDELDVPAIIERKPDVVLVDELAHTVHGEDTTAKRWQDVHRLLDAGINVISTVNIQHLESLNDVVTNITGHVQNETIPDPVLREAEEVELIDLSPDALRVRLRQGQVYGPATVDAALSKFFRKGNLTALRELALLWLADQVDDGLEKYRSEEGIKEPWAARERILVAVGGGQKTAALIRRGRRIAGRIAGRELLVVHVLAADGPPRMSPKQMSEARSLTESLGGSWHVLSGDDVPRTLLDFATTVNASQLVVGASRQGFAQRLLMRSTSATIIDGAGDIDVHIVAVDPPATHWSAPAPSTSLSPARLATGWVLATILTIVVTLANLALGDPTAHLPTAIMSFVLASVVVALVGGLWPALATAIGGALLLNWFFTAPTHTLSITEPKNIFLLIVFVLVAVLVAQVVDGAVSRQRESQEARRHAQLMTELARSVIRDGIGIQEILEQIATTFGQDGVALATVEGTTLVPDYEVGIRIESVTLADEAFSLDDQHVLALVGRPLTSSEQQLLEAYSGRLVSLMTQEQLNRTRTQARQLEAANSVRTALLTAVSHDLRTPLATIKTAVSGLLLDDVDLPRDAQVELLRTIESSSDRLDRIVADLLDMSRIHTNKLKVKAVTIGPAELVAQTLRHMDPSLVPPSLDERVPRELPAITTDAALMERVLENLISNAAKHTDSGVTIDATQDGERILIRVIDYGPGLTEESKVRLFTPFTRFGDTTNSHGLGLGAAVARGLAEGVGGTLTADDTPGGGLTMVLSLPLTITPATTDSVPTPAHETTTVGSAS